VNKDAEIILVTGGRGSGKTTRQIELTRGHDRVIVLDPIGSYKAQGFRTVRTLKEVYKAIKAGWHTGFKLILRTPSDEAGCIAVMKELAAALFIIQKPYYSGRDKRKIMLVIDEAHKFFPNRRMAPIEQEPLENIIALGRHYGIEMIAASQRIAKVWTEYRGNCSQSYFFMQGDHTDFSAVLSIIGNEHREALRGLKVHEYLHKGQGLNVAKGRNAAKFR
jgi:DNA helicase HerA-like ATPase